jgi:hypothetical protein
MRVDRSDATKRASAAPVRISSAGAETARPMHLPRIQDRLATDGLRYLGDLIRG